MNEISRIETGVTLSESAAKRINAMRESSGKPLKLRVSVLGGGCQGFKYKFEFTEAVSAEDQVFARNGAEIVTDDVSLDLLTGAEVNFVESLMSSYFELRNPNAASTCGCGTSFSAK
jgi:iron-sulfur cluster insertion protein